MRPAGQAEAHRWRTTAAKQGNVGCTGGAEARTEIIPEGNAEFLACFEQAEKATNQKSVHARPIASLVSTGCPTWCWSMAHRPDAFKKAGGEVMTAPAAT
jgi:hypothetical protein